MWNSVDLYVTYSEGGGFKYSRRTLINLLVDYFGDEVVLLSSPGLARILAFIKYSHFALEQMTVIQEFKNCCNSNQSRDVGHWQESIQSII